MRALSPQREKGVILVGMEVGLTKWGVWAWPGLCHEGQMARQNPGLRQTFPNQFYMSQFTKHPHTCPSYENGRSARLGQSPHLGDLVTAGARLGAGLLRHPTPLGLRLFS